MIETNRVGTPRASIIILTRHDPPQLARCLRSVARARKVAPPTELILVLNGADQDVESFVAAQVTDATVLRLQTNLGFSGGCNLAARHASGEYLVLLNDDTEVEEAWLRELVVVAEEHPDADAIGSRIEAFDETLQEAGSVIWSDGTTAPVGRGSPTEDCRFRHVRSVDYASACSLLVRRTAWESIGGLDEGYSPAYYEDADLGLALRSRGRRILIAPGSVVRHHESRSLTRGFKSFLFRRNHTRFRAKWGPELARQEPASTGCPGAIVRALHRAAGSPRRVLIIDDRWPLRALGSGFGRMLEATRDLTTGGFAVSFFAVGGSREPPSELSRLGVESVGGDLPIHLSGPNLYEAVMVSRPHNAERFRPALARWQPQAALVYDAEALFHRRVARQAATLLDRECDAEAGRLLALEGSLRAMFDWIVSVSAEEAAFFAATEGTCGIDVIPPLLPATFSEAPFNARSTTVFVAGWLGGEDAPNADGYRWFVAQVLPLIRRQVPWAQVHVTGAAPPPVVRTAESAGVVLTGELPALGPCYAGARVAVVPVRYGSGVKVKVLEALQHGVPVVTTPVGAEGVPLVPADALRVAEDPERFAQAVCDLLTDRGSWEAAHAALRGWEAAVRRAHPRGWTHVLDDAQLARTPSTTVARWKRARSADPRGRSRGAAAPS